MTTENHYTISDIENIKFCGFQYILPEIVLEIFKKLESELQITNVDTVETTTSHSNKKYQDDSTRTKRHNDHRNFRNQKTRDLTHDDWEMIRSFKTTKIDKKEGVEKNINNIRILLNKISNKNYDTQKIVILDSVAEIILNEENGSQEDIEKITQAIFDIVSSNKFFSEIYAKLYTELIERFPVFSGIFQNYIHIYKKSIDNIHFMDPNKDYDGFCSYTKLNEQRRAMTLFIINMYKMGQQSIITEKTVKEDVVTDILDYFLVRSLDYIDSDNRTNELEEITENIFLITSNIQKQIVENEEWNMNLLPVIIRISQMKFKDHKSLSNRVIFKYMDIIDSMDN